MRSRLFDRQDFTALTNKAVADRYTVDPAWNYPHFEKMPYDNAQLLTSFEAGVALDRKDFVAAGRDTLDFLLREMRDENGGVFASFDADSGGHEGSFYVWNPREMEQAAGQEDGPALAAVLGLNPGATSRTPAAASSPDGPIWTPSQGSAGPHPGRTLRAFRPVPPEPV